MTEAPTKKALSFSLDFSVLNSLKTSQIPANADEIWQKICDPFEPCKYSTLIDRITNPNVDRNHILEALGLKPRSSAILTTELRRHSRYLSKIIPPEALPMLSSEYVVSLPLLSRAVKEPDLLSLALHLLWNCVTPFGDNPTRIDILRKFSELLVPRSINSEFTNHERPYLKYLFFLPVEWFGGQRWLALESDRNTLHVFVPTRTGGMHDEKHQLDQIVCDLFANEISFSKKASPGVSAPFMTCNFESVDAAMVWKDALTVRADPMLCFVECLPFVGGHLNAAPQEFFDCIRAVINASDLDFVVSLANCAAMLSTDGMPYISAILSAMQRAKLLPYYIRQFFSEHIFSIDEMNMILKENTALPLSCTMYMEAVGKGYAEEVVAKATEHDGPIQEVIKVICSSADDVSPAMHFLLSTCFRAVRRRFGDGKAPLTSLANIILLRLLLMNPKLRSYSPETGFAQKLMGAFVFQKRQEVALTDADYQMIAEYLVAVSRPREGTCEFPVMDDDLKKILEFCFRHPELSAFVTKRLTRQCHPLAWTLFEVLESALPCEEDFHSAIEECELVSHR